MIASRMSPIWMPIIERETRSKDAVLPLCDHDADVTLCSKSIYKMPVPAMRMPPADMVVELSIFTTGRRVNVLSMRQPTIQEMTSSLFSLKNCAP